MRYSIEDVKKGLENTGWKVISDKYISLDSELIFECEEGHKVYSTWKKIRNKPECPICKEINILKETSWYDL